MTATTDPATVPALSTWELVPNRPAAAAGPVLGRSVPPAAVAPIVRLDGRRHGVEPSDTHVQGTLGGNAAQVRGDHAIRRHGARVCGACAVCWGAAGHDGSLDVDPPAAPAAPPGGPSPAAPAHPALEAGETSPPTAPRAAPRPAGRAGRAGRGRQGVERRGARWEPWTMRARDGQGHPIALSDSS